MTWKRDDLRVHEGFTTKQIVTNVLQEAAKCGAKRVVEVHLEIGKLTFLNPEQIRFWYDMLVKDTIMEGSRLIIKEKPGIVQCARCGYKGDFKYENNPLYHLPIPTLKCPECGGTVKIIDGRDCLIKDVKLLV